ncbi:hypothetical protein [Limosilactobacillus reuteri]|nr:hypothetical protein [Limosilactobacillus reuteri]
MLYLKRADEKLENHVLKQVRDLFGSNHGLKVFVKYQMDGTPVRNTNGMSEIVTMTSEDVQEALDKKTFAFVVER